MADTSGQPPSGATLEFLNHQAAQSRRARPPHLDPEAGYVERVPLRPEADGKLRRRESRLGLRNIFGWNKAAAPERGPAAPPSPGGAPAPGTPPRSAGIRASFAELNWPYSLGHGSGQRSEIALPSFSTPASISPDLKHKKSASVVRGQAQAQGTKGAIATWDPPPLFKAYPQSVKHSHLPACTASAETILRLHKSAFSQSSLTLDVLEESAVDRTDKSRKKHRRNTSNSSLKLEWTTKVFVLVTSGYLLQYTGSGSFDRLPERVLHLGKDSVAFASDVIPGRHWVLQVCSVAEPDRAPVSHAYSLLSRLPFRGQERRQASTLLMVFEGAEEMDGWITTLRREIEAMGGRKYLSETGKPKIDDLETQLKSQTSQRTLVVRDPDRFSRIMSMSPEMPWDAPMVGERPDIHLDPAEADMRDQSFDDTSTASVISHDGRQLDGLRDSTNRLSYISSGQRTVITSAGSSPACSPVRDSFVGPDEGYVPEMHLQDEPSRPRARPNAAAINDRRQSLQTSNHLFEMRLSSAQATRPHSTTYSGSWQQETETPIPPPVHMIPNFSVPQSAGKRYSVTRPFPGETIQTTTQFPGRVSSRRPPPTALAINGRPLSLVEDQPSPISSPLSEDDAFSSTTVGDTPSTFSPWVDEFGKERRGSSASDLPDSQQDPKSMTGHSMHRRQLSSNSVQSVEKPRRSSGRQTPVFVLPDNIPPRPPSPFSPLPQDIIRPKSSLDYYSRTQSPTTMSVNESLRSRRLSLYAQDMEKPAFVHREYPLRSRTPSLKPVQRSSQHLRVDSLSKNLLQRRSLSQLAEGPPPGPPPTRALPPIPRRVSGACMNLPGGRI